MTRRSSRWPLAIALMIAAAPAAFAQTPMVPDMPPPPPPAAPPMPDATPAAKQAPGPPGVAAIVNGKKILRSQVADAALQTVGNQVVGQLILIALIDQEAAKQHVVVTPAQVDAKMTELRAQYAEQYAAQQYAAPGLPPSLDALLAQKHQSLATYKSQLTTELKIEALVAKTVKPTPSPVKYHARHLLILTTPLRGGAPNAKPPHTDAEALALIHKAQADLKAGKSFAEVANKYTEDPSGKGKGGDLGLIDAQTTFNPNFLQAALKLKPGEVTPTPVKSEYGYHLIKIDSTSAAPTPADRKLYADAGAAARRQQVQQAIPAYVHGLAQRAKIIDYLGEAPTFTPASVPGR